MANLIPGKERLEQDGWWAAHQWLVLRRVSQIAVLTLFLIGPLVGVWLIEGNMSSSLLLDTIPLTDPMVLGQSLTAGHWPDVTALIGAGLVMAFYLLVGGRVYCSWVCPINMITDLASWLRRKLNIRTSMRIDSNLRYWLLGLALALPLATGSLVWELVNPVTLFSRGLLFGLGWGWGLIGLIFLFDLLVSKNGWCGHLCPVGAFYGLLGKFSFLRISAVKREACDDCMDCYKICPEPRILKPVLKGINNHGPVIDTGSCTNCGRCLDVCAKGVFKYAIRLEKRS
ncbi:quinol dehydrogenase ferredoxin subunit NapH [Pelagibaculum spongiae]|uniref:Quinol dehydrogenase ferredoxin subunit NapH n=1 Tax=Pelagibaculum spongiae TaxID=2080658 RepID=A0A2V1GUJ5_9GAMM|nr:quinol dehydrogenase ferredoxin subunit NapH [Pelagibaculum spongiae]PVZ68980.1 quinol dehydrogenase ferredoxin subunit NapH [Pelagibaculum spongiae]